MVLNEACLSWAPQEIRLWDRAGMQEILGECLGDQPLQWGASGTGSKGSKIRQRETLDYDTVVMDLSQRCSEL